MIKFPEVFDLSRFAVCDAVVDQGDVLIHVALVYIVRPYQINFYDDCRLNGGRELLFTLTLTSPFKGEEINGFFRGFSIYPHPDFSLFRERR